MGIHGSKHKKERTPLFPVSFSLLFLSLGQFVQRLVWDHPRACGEHIPFHVVERNTLGSSPRLRGTLGLLLEVGLLFGIIPALAGNTRAMESQTYAPRDHPRACGEHIVRYELYELERGSSPRLRGTLFNCFAHVVDVWIIPALAGNTPAPTRTWATSGDHPRACGEHCCICDNFGQNMGSSPRLRGTRPYLYDASTAHGIIPALAGNTRP